MSDKELISIMRSMIKEQQTQLRQLLQLLEHIIDSEDTTIEVKNSIRETMLKMGMEMKLSELEGIMQ